VKNLDSHHTQNSTQPVTGPLDAAGSGLNTPSTAPVSNNFQRFSNHLKTAWPDYLLLGLLLVLGLAAAWLPVDWTRNLKRPAQAPNYAWLNLIYTLVYGGAAWWLWRSRGAEERFRHKWLALALLVFLPNLFNIWLRFTSPLTATDPRPLFGRDADIDLYYHYGLALTQGHWPTTPSGQFAEYPQLSFPFFWLGVVLSGSNRESFYWIFPLLMTFCQFGAAASLYGLGLKLGRARPAFLLSAWIAGCPALLLFGYTRFDAGPTALLLAGVYFAIPGDLTGEKGLAAARRWRRWAWLSGFLLAAGALVKWLPAVAWPWLAAGYWRSRNWAALRNFSLASLLGGLVFTLPPLVINTPAMLYPYKFHGSRRLIGESFWFLVQTAFFDPTHSTPEKPWGEPPKIVLGNNWITLVQLALTGLVFGLTLWRLWSVSETRPALTGWAASGMLGVAVFTLANRIFSPQYLVILLWVWAVALVLRPVAWRSLLVALAFMTLAAAANFEVYLLGAYPDIWVRDSVVVFAASFGLTGWLLWRVLYRPEKN
jgi:hypothetical protein